MTGVGLVALPYDRDSVLRELESRARTPRPPKAPLESLFAEFRGPFAAYSAATIRLGKLRDSLDDAKERARHPPARRLGLRPALRYVRPAGRLAQDRTGCARSAPAPSSTVRGSEFAARGDSLRLRMRQWEDSTYQGYDSIVQGLARRSGASP